MVPSPYVKAVSYIIGRYLTRLIGILLGALWVSSILVFLASVVISILSFPAILLGWAMGGKMVFHWGWMVAAVLWLPLAYEIFQFFDPLMNKIYAFIGQHFE